MERYRYIVLSVEQHCSTIQPHVCHPKLQTFTLGCVFTCFQPRHPTRIGTTAEPSPGALPAAPPPPPRSPGRPGRGQRLPSRRSGASGTCRVARTWETRTVLFSPCAAGRWAGSGVGGAARGTAPRPRQPAGGRALPAAPGALPGSAGLGRRVWVWVLVL